MTPNDIRAGLQQAAKEMRQLALDFHAMVEPALEQDFQHWQAETVFPQAVNRWIHEIGADA